MINIHIIRNSEGYIREFTIKGHAGFDKHGKDIVCAAVSAIAYTAAGALDELAGIGSCREKDGYMECSVPADIRQDKKSVAGIILEAAYIGFKQIENSYGDYVEVLNEEV
jgi:uncharacterized protein YsxB (DUF464 family)